ncbi:rhodanese-like domain-containing protein [Weeksella sp. HMSC059D05]|nr:rhodanese-like domain-containing protein [Weeksella sp. HMSC059D05]MDK7675967.1 rhodanese-like domain-containing protein [Weeksella virosa]
MNRLLGKKNRELENALMANPYLVDVRSEAEFANGSVEGAVNIPLDKITTQLETLRKHSCIVVFCRSGFRSGMAKKVLQQKGILAVVNGGKWQHVQRAKQSINQKS